MFSKTYMQHLFWKVQYFYLLCTWFSKNKLRTYMAVEKWLKYHRHLQDCKNSSCENTVSTLSTQTRALRSLMTARDSLTYIIIGNWFAKSSETGFDKYFVERQLQHRQTNLRASHADGFLHDFLMALSLSVTATRSLNRLTYNFVSTATDAPFFRNKNFGSNHRNALCNHKKRTSTYPFEA